VRVTWQAGDAAAFVHEAVQLHRSGAVQYDTIIAAGGDGTLSEVAAALVESGGAALPLALGLLPLGTGNDFAAVTGISMVGYYCWELRSKGPGG
jgi:diacylglycerol kinase family enzyme